MASDHLGRGESDITWEGERVSVTCLFSVAPPGVTEGLWLHFVTGNVFLNQRTLWTQEVNLCSGEASIDGCVFDKKKRLQRRSVILEQHADIMQKLSRCENESNRITMPPFNLCIRARVSLVSTEVETLNNGFSSSVYVWYSPWNAWINKWEKEFKVQMWVRIDSSATTKEGGGVWDHRGTRNRGFLLSNDAGNVHK